MTVSEKDAKDEQLGEDVFRAKEAMCFAGIESGTFIQMFTELLTKYEQMMKQEPYPLEDVLIHCGYLTHDQVIDISESIPALYAKPVPQDQQIHYQAAVSGLWYENPTACGDISAIKVNNNIYKLNQQIPPRISEQDAREIAGSVFQYCRDNQEFFKWKTDYWIESEGNALLAKLNQDRGITNE